MVRSWPWFYRKILIRYGKTLVLVLKTNHDTADHHLSHEGRPWWDLCFVFMVLLRSNLSFYMPWWPQFIPLQTVVRNKLLDVLLARMAGCARRKIGMPIIYSIKGSKLIPVTSIGHRWWQLPVMCCTLTASVMAYETVFFWLCKRRSCTPLLVLVPIICSTVGSKLYHQRRTT